MMSDFLVDLGAKPIARKAIKTLGLPIPLPQKLKRSDTPWEERPLEDQPVVVFHGTGAEFADLTARTVTGAGGDSWVMGDPDQAGPYKEYGDAWGRQPTTVAGDDLPENLRPRALIFDASGMKGPGELKAMYTFFHGWVRKLAPCGRALILSRPPEEAGAPETAACAQAVNGFVRSMAREIGRNGSTAQTVYIDRGAEENAEPVLRFFLSSRSAYITAQPIHISKTVTLEGKAPARRPLDGKVALVTGAAQGIGASTAAALAREGAHVVGMDRPSENGPLSRLMDELGGSMLLCDITAEDAPEVVCNEIRKKFKGIDIVVHNAGVTRDKMLANMDEDRWDMTLGVNLVSLIRLNEALKELFRKDGRVICMASIAGIAGNMGQTNYSASKAGVIGYVRALAPSLAGSDVTINAIAPGFIETRMTAAVPLATREVARRLCNLSQGGHPEDIGELVTFLASPGAAGITGEVIRICGGNYIGA
jgi:3-oxoacyl-[acyl-carrier protein] reductase